MDLNLHHFHLNFPAAFIELQEYEARLITGIGWPNTPLLARTLWDLGPPVLQTTLPHRRIGWGSSTAVTSDLTALADRQGYHAAIVNAKGKGKGKIESDVKIYWLCDELLLDFEPGLTGNSRSVSTNTSSPTRCRWWM